MSTLTVNYSTRILNESGEKFREPIKNTRRPQAERPQSPAPAKSVAMRAEQQAASPQHVTRSTSAADTSLQPLQTKSVANYSHIICFHLYRL